MDKKEFSGLDLLWEVAAILERLIKLLRNI